MPAACCPHSLGPAMLSWPHPFTQTQRKYVCGLMEIHPSILIRQGYCWAKAKRKGEWASYYLRHHWTIQYFAKIWLFLLFFETSVHFPVVLMLKCMFTNTCEKQINLLINIAATYTYISPVHVLTSHISYKHTIDLPMQCLELIS